MSKTTTSRPARAAAVASAAVFLALASLANAAPAPAGSSGTAIAGSDTVHCYGVHSCKGMSDCKTANHECKGHNSCKGDGFKAMTASACLAAEGTIGDIQ